MIGVVLMRIVRDFSLPVSQVSSVSKLSFSVTDILVSYTVNWGYDDGLIDDFPNLMAYLERLHEREHCTLAKL